MIRLYRPASHRFADDIQDVLETLCVKHEIIVEERELPYLVDGTNTYHEEKAIREYLETLKEAISTWNRFDGDNCLCKADANQPLSPSLKAMFNIDQKQHSE